jgi:hypothetical protein
MGSADGASKRRPPGAARRMWDAALSLRAACALACLGGSVASNRSRRGSTRQGALLAAGSLACLPGEARCQFAFEGSGTNIVFLTPGTSNVTGTSDLQIGFQGLESLGKARRIQRPDAPGPNKVDG